MPINSQLKNPTHKPLCQRPPSVRNKFSDDEGALNISSYEISMIAMNERNEEIKQAIEDDSKASIFRNRDASLFYTITNAANGGKRYQVTVWNKTGSLSDSKHDDAESIIRHYGYGTELAIDATEQEFNALLAKEFITTLPVG
jgi:hypothetical protein